MRRGRCAWCHDQVPRGGGGAGDRCGPMTRPRSGPDGSGVRFTARSRSAVSIAIRNWSVKPFR
ncbi:hypothetical protein APASM_4879 [Actinosynnema pretiosum subsp. pretiosum]|nr:hypothetical protein APASM_4879 [Actinosynnema pretiosum subsp. pretiosum]